MTGPHTCHAPRCSTALPPGLLFCPSHWKMLQPKIREKIMGVWKALRECPSATLAQVLDDYRSSLAEAVQDIARQEAHLSGVLP